MYNCIIYINAFFVMVYIVLCLMLCIKLCICNFGEHIGCLGMFGGGGGGGGALEGCCDSRS